MDVTRNVERCRSRATANRCPGCVGICDDGFGKFMSFVLVESTESLQELLTREDPFHPISGPFIMLRILRGPPDRPSAEDTCFRLTDEWWSIFSECWHTEPSMRPTMSQVAKRIGQIVRSSPDARLSIID